VSDLDAFAEEAAARNAPPAPAPPATPPPEFAGVTATAFGDVDPANPGSFYEALARSAQAMAAAARGGDEEDDQWGGIFDAIAQGVVGGAAGAPLEGWLGDLANRLGFTDVTSETVRVDQIAREWLETMDARAFVEVQRRMWVLGLYGSGTPTWGKMDPATLAAATDFFGFASSDPETSPFQQLLDATAGNTMFPESAEANEAKAMDLDPIQVILASPADLARLIDESYRTTLGKRATADDQRAFVAAFHAFQRDSAEANARYAMQAQDALEASAVSGERATVEGTAPMSQETFIDQYLQEADPVAYQGEQAVDIAQTISGNLGRA
jgi:hypothetical protein